MDAKNAEKSADTATPAEPELHKPPSVLWLAIPLGLIVAYALLTR